MNGFDAYQGNCFYPVEDSWCYAVRRAIRFLRQAIADIERCDYAAKGTHISKAQDILFELNTVLDMEQGGQIAQNLRSLYNFMHTHLAKANLRKDPQMIREVIAILEELNQGWRAITG